MPNPATFFYLTIQYDKVWIKYNGTHGGDHYRPITSVNDLENFLISKANEAKIPVEDLRVYCSSTMDFPHEFTENAATVALAHAIRG